MKKTSATLLTLVAVLALSASSVAVAQSDMGNTSTAGSTFALGTVDSFGTDSVTVLKDSGDRVTILLGAHTVGKQNLANGNRVRIDYRNNEQGRPVAEEIEIGAGVPLKVVAAPIVETTVVEAPIVEAPVVAVQATRPVESYRAEPVTAPNAPEVTASTTLDAPIDELPATASSLPTFALLGLLALAGGLAVRMIR